MIRKGHKFSNNPVLLINQPIESESSDSIEYTATQPRRVGSNNEQEEISEQDFKRQSLSGSKLNSHYLDKVYPGGNAGGGPMSSVIEFLVNFKYSGSFFVQIEYYDELAQSNVVTEPQYLNVEPIMLIGNKEVRCKELSIISVLSRQLGHFSRWEKVISNIADL